MSDTKLRLLPREQMEAQLSQVDLLLAMYPAEGEIFLDIATQHSLENLRNWTISDDRDLDETTKAVPSSLSFEINVEVEIHASMTSKGSVEQPKRLIQLSIEVPVRSDTLSVGLIPDDSPPPLKVHLRQPNWLTRAQTSQLNSLVADEIETDVFTIIENIREAISTLHDTPAAVQTGSDPNTIPSKSTSPRGNGQLAVGSDSLVRVWFYFPSISTRAKRDDLVHYAPVYSLTGFVLAGKPGILCLEGQSRQIDEYMKFIKTESWGDIPSHHKKVSERYREALSSTSGTRRVFDGMQEITDAEWMGEKRGERGNRNDFKALEAWLTSLGLKSVLEKVLF